MGDNGWHAFLWLALRFIGGADPASGFGAKRRSCVSAASLQNENLSLPPRSEVPARGKEHVDDVKGYIT
jgi:hypothetical protein